ncbi:MAG: Fic family protein [Bacteroidia bacterium]
MPSIHTLELDLDFALLHQLSLIDRFSGEWANIERKEGLQSLKHLKSIATVQSVGASTRIEGSKMTNAEINTLIFENLKIDKLEARDQQEVVGYFQTLDLLCESYQDIRIAIGDVKNLHSILLKHSQKDQWHKGTYKQQSNSVDAHYPDGTKVTLFQTTAPGIETEQEMLALYTWYADELIAPPIIKVAVFVYEFLSIHPFQDGNGRLSRLLTTLLLLKNGYSWIQYVSFEHEIEARKNEYYKVLMDCQQNRPGENINAWLVFFLNCLSNIQTKLMQKLEVQKAENKMSPREKIIFLYIDNNPGAKSSDIASHLNIPLPSVKRMLAEMTRANFLAKYGSGAGTNYTTEKLVQIKNNVAIRFTNEIRKHDFLFKNKHAFVEIKKILLTPKFEWSKPDDWEIKLAEQNPMIHLKCRSNAGELKQSTYALASFNNIFRYQPIFTLNMPIHIPESVWEGLPYDKEFPIQVSIEIEFSGDELKFDTMLVYDAAFE